MRRRKLSMEERSQEANKLLQFRKENGFTQAALASILGVCPQTIAYIELGTISKPHGVSKEISIALKKIGLEIEATGRSGRMIRFNNTSEPNFLSKPRIPQQEENVVDLIKMAKNCAERALAIIDSKIKEKEEAATKILEEAEVLKVSKLDMLNLLKGELAL